jgi:ribosomal-protein-serine acetyltransferase
MFTISNIWYFNLMKESTEIEVEPDLWLRQLKLDQAEQLFELIDENREYLSEWLPYIHNTNEIGDVRSFVESEIDKRVCNQGYSYFIERRDKIIGHVSLMNLNGDKEPEIGYWVTRDASGEGIATRAVNTLTAFGLNLLGLKQVIIRAHPNNVGSNKVAKKAGYKLIGRTNDENEGPRNVWESLAP